MNIKDISWPIFAIGSHDKIYKDMGVLYIDVSGKTYILDNKNISGDTLGKRRLKLNKEDLYPFRGTIFSYNRLMQRPGNKKYIDNNGNIFKTSKNKFKPLKYFKIKEVKQLGDKLLIKVYGTKDTFTVNRGLYKYDYIYLGALDHGTYYTLYELSEELKEDTRRKV